MLINPDDRCFRAAYGYPPKPVSKPPSVSPCLRVLRVSRLEASRTPRAEPSTKPSKSRIRVTETWPVRAEHIFSRPLPCRPKGVSVCSVVKNKQRGFNHGCPQMRLRRHGYTQMEWPDGWRGHNPCPSVSAVGGIRAISGFGQR